MSDLPFVSVIMPIRNEAKFIRYSLGAVLAQDYPQDRLEVLIADGMSDDGTRAIIRETGAVVPNIPVTIIDNPRRIVPTGFNRALAAARGDIIVRVDGHTIIEPDYVATCVDVLARSGCDNVGGKMQAIGETPFAQSVALAISCAFGVGGARFHYSNAEEQVDTVYMGAWRRSLFEQIGGFDERFVRSQDSEFNYRLRAHGGTILLSPRIKSTYYARSSPRRLWTQYYQYGFYKVQVIFRHPAQFRGRQLVAPVFVLALLSGAPLAWVGGLLWALWLAGVAAYMLANLAFSLKIALRHGIAHFPRLLVIYPIIHLSWGLGFLNGLFRVVLPGRAPEVYRAGKSLRLTRQN